MRKIDRQVETRIAAANLGHTLGRFESKHTPSESRAECTACGAEVFVSFDPGERGWYRAPGYEIQVQCTNDLAQGSR